MQYCPKCKVHIRGNKRCCPLCEGSLTGSPSDPAFPALEQRRFSFSLIFKVCLFLFVIVSEQNLWSMYAYYMAHDSKVQHMF